MALKISVLTTEYILTEITATEEGVEVDPTGNTVEFAFINVTEDTDPTSGDWVSGSWETDVDGNYFARCLVGPLGDVTLAVGTYEAWVRITDAPERPVRQFDKVKVV